MSRQLELFPPPEFKLAVGKSGRPVAWGSNVPIQKVAMFGLSPGDKVIQIGQYGRNGKITSSNRVDLFKPGAVVYEGILEALDFAEETGNAKHLCFRDLLFPEPLYMLYEYESGGNSIEGEIFCYDFKSCTPLFYKIHFVKEND